MALVELQNQGILKYLVSQNCDGLHRKSGVLPVSSIVPVMTIGSSGCADRLLGPNIRTSWQQQLGILPRLWKAVLAR